MARQESLLCGEQHYREIAARYAAYFVPGRLVFLRGPMGAGKTTFVRALCAELDVDDLVSSPSFAVLNLYHAPGFRVAHFDLFRLDAGAQLDDIGALDFVDARTLTLVEWPENCPGFFPRADLDLAFAFPEEDLPRGEAAPFRTEHRSAQRTPSGGQSESRLGCSSDNSLMRCLTISTPGADSGAGGAERSEARKNRASEATIDFCEPLSLPSEEAR